MSFRIEEMRVPRLSEQQIAWQSEGLLDPNYEIQVDNYVLIYWEPGTASAPWPTIDDIYMAIRDAHVRYGPNERIIIQASFPKTGDRIMGVEFI